MQRVVYHGLPHHHSTCALHPRPSLPNTEGHTPETSQSLWTQTRAGQRVYHNQRPSAYRPCKKHEDHWSLENTDVSLINKIQTDHWSIENINYHWLIENTNRPLVNAKSYNSLVNTNYRKIISQLKMQTYHWSM